MTISALPPVFDLNGSLFLGVYLTGMFITLIWSLIRRYNIKRKLSHSDTPETTLTDPYEIAYLAGGAPRCAEVATIKLITSGAALFEKTRFTKEGRLISNGPAQPDFHSIERALLGTISGHGKRGMPLLKISESLATKLGGVESKLAKMGLRPTASELKSINFSIGLPMFLWIGFGLIKMFVGISRDKPIGILIFLMIVTFVIAGIVATYKSKLTPNGQNLLKKMRASQNHENDTLHIVALFGAASISSHYISGLDPMLLKDISGMGTSTNPSGSSGCSTGCSSGCGGGGCGGCGGD